eukprot:gene21125-28012_t
MDVAAVHGVTMDAVHKYDFYAREMDVAAVDGVTVDAVRAFYKKYLLSASPQRRKLSIQIQPLRLCAAVSETTVHPNAPAPSEAHTEAAKKAVEAAAVAQKLLDKLVKKGKRKCVVVSDMKAFKAMAKGLTPRHKGAQPKAFEVEAKYYLVVKVADPNA